MFNLKKKECQEKFRQVTGKTKELTQIEDSNKDLNMATKKLLKRIDGFVHQCFKKIRVTDKVDKELEDLYDLRRELKGKDDSESKIKLKEVEEELANKYSEEMYDKIKGELKDINEETGWNPGHLWKMKKKLSPRQSDPPAAMKSTEGKLLTDKNEILNEAVKYFEKLFEQQKMKPDYQEIQNVKEKLWKQRFEKCKQNKTKPWEMKDLLVVLKYLKTNIILLFQYEPYFLKVLIAYYT